MKVEAAVKVAQKTPKASEDSEDSEASDLFEIFLKPVEELSDDELRETIERLRSLRKVRINTKKGKTVLDQILEQLSPENAQKVLQHMNLGKAKEDGKKEQDRE